MSPIYTFVCGVGVGLSDPYGALLAWGILYKHEIYQQPLQMFLLELLSPQMRSRSSSSKSAGEIYVIMLLEGCKRCTRGL